MLTQESTAATTMPMERLEAEITELAGHLIAAECRWLLLVAEFDRRAGYEQWGCRTSAHWLNWHCGLDLRAAREKVRVARALDELPVTTEEFASGKLSYSKVRALTRIATPTNEAELAALAEHATAVHVEKIVRAYRHVTTAAEACAAANALHAARYLRVDPANDGSFVVNGRIPAGLAAIVLKALDVAREHLPAAPAGGDGPAGPSPDPTVTNVDALAMMAETLLAAGPSARKGGDRYQIVVNVDDDVLVDDAEGGVCELDGGPSLAAETVRRLMCDASAVFVLRDETGRPVNATNKTRTIPPSLRRAVHARDNGCRFPGCGERRFVDVHHARHRAHGGPNERANLMELCWFHHRLVHEGGWNVRFETDGVVLAITPEGNVLARDHSTRVTDDHGIEHRNHDEGITVDHSTCIPRWYGDPLDLHEVVTGLECIDRRGSCAGPVSDPTREPAADAPAGSR